MRGRDHSLDGLRGVAALSVVFCHFADAFIPSLEPAESHDLSWLANTPLSLLYNGQFAVSIFFVLSGYVVSGSAASGRHSLPVLLASRYVRLGVPAMFSTLFAWRLMNSFPGGLPHLQSLLPHPWLDWNYGRNTPGVAAAAFDGAVGVFIHGSSRFNNVLWTMKYELVGSILIYLVYFVPARWRWPAIAAFACVGLMSIPYEAFVVGVLFRERPQILNPRWGWPALLLGVLLGSQLPGFGARIGLPPGPAALALGDSNSIWYVIGGAGFVYAALALEPFRGFLTSAPCRFLGAISFPLYLVHVPLLCTVFAGLYGAVPLPILFSIFLASALGTAWLAEKLVDAPTLRLIKAAQFRAPALLRTGSS